jgi:hypothetical protein
MPADPKAVTADSLTARLVVMLEYIDAAGWASYDNFDWWATAWGQRLKQWAYRTEPVGNLLFAAPLLACELWLPWLRKPLAIPKRVYPISIAHHGLSCVELYRKTHDPQYLGSARRDAALLVTQAIPAAKGLCWGFPFVWSTNVGIIPANQPAATQSAYGFDLFEQLWTVTGERQYLAHLLSVARAMAEEYVDLPQPEGVAHTYHGRGYGDIVINAISYRLYVLAAAMDQGAEHYAPTVRRLLQYLLSQQQTDGSWWYGTTAKNRFIDHFHTCFVLKNLQRANRVLQLPEIAAAIERGVHLYWTHLFDAQGLPKPFARTVRLNLVRYESYDFAECLGLFALFGQTHEFTAARLWAILDGLFDRFCLPDGALRFRVYRVPTATGYPYYRFGMTAAMLALAQLLNSEWFLESQANVGAAHA